MKLSHIMIPSDLSPEGMRPCAHVAELARALGSRITLLHVTEDPPVSLSVPGESLPLPSNLQERMAAARAQLETLRALFPKLDVRIEVISATDAVPAIVDFARANDVDLIAMSSHGRTGLRHLLLGSVAEAVLRRSPVPLVIFPLHGMEETTERKST